jgi:diguanylate cyclase (GGDEF)-like protein
MQDITQQAILTIILIAIVANLVVAVALLVTPRLRARRGDSDRGAEIDRQELMRAHLFGGRNSSNRAASARFMNPDPVAVAGSRSFGDEADDGFSDVDPDQDMPLAADAAEAMAVPADLVADVAATDDASVDNGAVAAFADLGDVISTDATTGFDGPSTWSKRLAEENARVLRYGRSATIILIELAGLDRLAERLGPAAADRLIPPIATTMRRHARSADSLARLSPTRFAALLPDTDEVKAINYVERVRSACDIWLESGAVSLRLSIGWAEISANQPVDPAILAAERRLNVERQRNRGQESFAVEDDRDVVAAQMRTARAN